MKKIAARLLCSAVLFAPGAAMAQSAASYFTSAVRYDLAHRVVGTIAPDPDGAGPLHHLAVRNTYDANGRLILVEKGELASWQSEAVAPASWSGFTVQQTVDTVYDLLDRKVKESVSSGGTVYQVTQYSYDSVGRLQCTAVRMDPALFGSLPASACDQTNPSNPIDRITKNSYDDAGQLVQVRKAVGTGIEQAYVTYSYTQNGKQEYVVDANGNKARLTWDEYDRQAQWQFPSATAPTGFNPSTPANALATSGAVNANDYEAYGYDLNGNRTTMRKRDGRVFSYDYDALNRMKWKIVPDCPATGPCCPIAYVCASLSAAQTRDVYYSYNARGLQTAARFDGFAGADAVLSDYDGFNRLRHSTTSMGGTSRTLDFEYDADGNRTVVRHPDGHVVNYYRDGLDRLHYADQAGVGPLFYPPYDAQGRVSTLYRWVNSGWNNYTAYGYDGISRLTSAATALTSGSYNVTQTFAYNPASQIVTRTRDNNLYAFNAYTNVSRSYTPNGLNQYASVAGNSYGYDSNGNLTADGINAYTYDAENRLVVTSAGAQLTYDPLGRLYETYKASTGTTRFLYDGDQLSAEYDGSGNLLRRYVHSDGEDDPLVWYEGAGVSSPRYLYTDHQGSITAVTDASGNAITVNSYDEYGVPGSGNVGRFQYTGQAWIPELGMYYYKARIYSPMLGRFMQTDPIGYEDQVNLYSYVGNDPVNGKDPTGLYECGTKRACAAAEKGIGQIKDAKNYWSSKPTGSLFARNSQAAKNLGSILKSIGTKGDGGVNVADARLGGDNGNYDRMTNTISLDIDFINKEGGIIGATFAHEIQHYRQRNDPSAQGIFGEIRPMGMSFLVNRAFGDPLARAMGIRDYVKTRLEAYGLPIWMLNNEFPGAWQRETSKPF